MRDIEEDVQENEEKMPIWLLLTHFGAANYCFVSKISSSISSLSFRSTELKSTGAFKVKEIIYDRQTRYFEGPHEYLASFIDANYPFPDIRVLSQLNGIIKMYCFISTIMNTKDF